MLITADKVLYGGIFHERFGIKTNHYGRVMEVGPLSVLGRPDRTLSGKALLPGMVNAHSHAFQRLLRGITQVAGPSSDTFWTWRQAMYHVASKLEPQDVYMVARQVFLEMLLCGITTVGEFHYLHNTPEGVPYQNPYAMLDALLHAAGDVGIRLAVIHTVYLRGDFNTLPNATQKRFCAPSLDAACDYFDAAVERIISHNDPRLSWAIAAHSIRGVPYDAIVGLKTRLGHMPYHIHVSEQAREVEACMAQHGVSPIELLVRAEVCDASTTLIHATHATPREVELLQNTGSIVCVCPTTEADLGDGLTPAADMFARGIKLCLGTDGQTQTSLLSEMRSLEMHERLRLQARNLLTTGPQDSPATNLWSMATRWGSAALGVDAGVIAPGKYADFVTFDLQDPALAGANDASLLAAITFSADSRAIRDVIVGGAFVVEDGVHPQSRPIQQSYTRLCHKLLRS